MILADESRGVIGEAVEYTAIAVVMIHPVVDGACTFHTGARWLALRGEPKSCEG